MNDTSDTSSIKLKPGTRCMTLGLPAFGGFPGVPPESLTIQRTRKMHLPMPGEDWYIVQFDGDNGYLCMHRSGFRVIDNR